MLTCLLLGLRYLMLREKYISVYFDVKVKPNWYVPVFVLRSRHLTVRMSYMLPHLHNGWQVDQAILSEEDRVLVIRFGHDWDPTCMKMDEVLYSIAEKVGFGIDSVFYFQKPLCLRVERTREESFSLSIHSCLCLWGLFSLLPSFRNQASLTENKNFTYPQLMYSIFHLCLCLDRWRTLRSFTL